MAKKESENLPIDINLPRQNLIFGSWEEATSAKKNIAWKQLASIKVNDGVESWLETLNGQTAKSYKYGIRKLGEMGLIDFELSIQAFSQVNHNSIIDQIKLVHGWSEQTRQSRAACYISFTGFLSRRTDGIVLKAVPLKEGTARTFFRVRQKVKTKAMSQKESSLFLNELQKINPRDALIGKLMLQGGKRVSEVLSLNIEDIIWEENIIAFTQSKTRGTDQKIYITYPDEIMTELDAYLGNRRKGTVFITWNHRPVHPGQIERNFAKAGARAGINFKVTPHVLRTTLVTFLKLNGYGDTDIMKVTGHHSAEMVAAYDKMDNRDNPSQKISLV